MTEEYKYHAFISYSRRDSDEVNSLIQTIKAEVTEFKYWFDLDGIESGDEFVRKIVSAIDGSELILFMLSDNSINSKWAEQEVMYARNSGKRIIPVLLKGAKLKGWFLFTFGNIDSIDTGDARQMSKLISNLHQWCGADATKSATLPPQPSATTSTPLSTPAKTIKTDLNLVPTTEVEYPEAIKKDGKWGFRYKGKRKFVIPCIYEDVSSFYRGRARAKKDGKWGLIDLEGNTVVPYIFDDFRGFSDGCAVVKKDGKLGYLNCEGKTIVPCICEAARSFSDGRAAAKKDGKWGFIDTDGNTVIPFIYEDLTFSDGRMKVKKDGKWSYIDCDGNPACL